MSTVFYKCTHTDIINRNPNYGCNQVVYVCDFALCKSEIGCLDYFGKRVKVAVKIKEEA